jgi:hypothetical protein
VYYEATGKAQGAVSCDASQGSRAPLSAPLSALLLLLGALNLWLRELASQKSNSSSALK